MAIFKCKMCGGNIEIPGEETVVVCEYCGTTQTIAKSRDEVISNMFNRANDLRMKCEFDRAEQLYEKILAQDNTDAEAHWGMVLCKYGIEYVEDPKTRKKLPTSHRASYESILSDVEYSMALQYADEKQRAVYVKEAKEINEIQKSTLEIIKSEKPFDVFLCYKETDENGKRTVDSVIANDIYYELQHAGYKVFYAPITLEDKLGTEYEPYIFSALNSAQVMLVLGTKPEYFNSVWVKNEWSRYLKVAKKDRKKLLIPCYRDMDAYDLPDEFAHLQSQDMGKIGFINDIIRGIKKVIVTEQEPVAANRVAAEKFTSPMIDTDAVADKEKKKIPLYFTGWEKGMLVISGVASLLLAIATFGGLMGMWLPEISHHFYSGLGPIEILLRIFIWMIEAIVVFYVVFGKNAEKYIVISPIMLLITVMYPLMISADRHEYGYYDDMFADLALVLAGVLSIVFIILRKMRKSSFSNFMSVLAKFFLIMGIVVAIILTMGWRTFGDHTGGTLLYMDIGLMIPVATSIATWVRREK